MISIDLQISWQAVVLTFLIGTLGSILVCLPSLVRISKLNPAQLFRSESPQSTQRNWKLFLIACLPVLLFYTLISFWQAKSWLIGGIFLGSFALVLAILAGAASLVLFVLQQIQIESYPKLRLSLRSLTRHKIGSTLCFVAIGSGTFLASIPEQIQSIVFDELYQKDPNLPTPSFFLFDIQQHQVEPLKQFLIEKNIKLEDLSPMVRGRMTHLNGKILEGKEGRRFQRRNVNLSYRSELSISEEVVEGQAITESYDEASGQLPQISLVWDYAKQRDINIGDKLMFDVQGLPIEGEVVNFRQVLWTSFRPNFFISFQTGVLEDAPKTYVGVITSVPEDRRPVLQHQLSKQFTNIAALDISQSIDDISERIEQIVWALRVIASATLIVGLVVLFAIAQSETKSRDWEVGLLKTLGASLNNIRLIVYTEFCILCFSSIVVGTLMSMTMSQVVSWFIFNKIGSISWVPLIIHTLSILSFSLLVSAIAVSHSLRQVPLKLLRAV